MVPFPFSAIVAQDELKLALQLVVTDPDLGGVLVFGERGTGKSTAVRALAALLPKMRAVEGCVYHCDPAPAAARLPRDPFPPLGPPEEDEAQGVTMRRSFKYLGESMRRFSVTPLTKGTLIAQRYRVVDHLVTGHDPSLHISLCIEKSCFCIGYIGFSSLVVPSLWLT